jgi:hypothetical protein
MSDQIAFSPSGEVVAMYYKDSGAIEVWTGLPDTPQIVVSKPYGNRNAGFRGFG